IILGLMVMVVSCAGVAWDYVRSYEAETSEVRHGLEQFATIASTMVDGDLHRTLTSPDQVGSEPHKKALAQLIRFHRAMPDINYVYTCVLRGDGVHFVLDTSTSAAELGTKRTYQPSLIGELYKEPDKALIDSLRNGTVTSTEKPYTDEYGTFMSG